MRPILKSRTMLWSYRLALIAAFVVVAGAGHKWG